jgi:hypothetical protein
MKARLSLYCVGTPDGIRKAVDEKLAMFDQADQKYAQSVRRVIDKMIEEMLVPVSDQYTLSIVSSKTMFSITFDVADEEIVKKYEKAKKEPARKAPPKSSAQKAEESFAAGPPIDA